MKHLYLCCLISLLLNSCSSWLEREPIDALSIKSAFSTPQELNSALTGLHHLLSREELCGRNQLLFADLIGGNARLDFGDFRTIGELQMNPFNSRVLELWASSYQAINQANLILAAVDEVAQDYPDFSAAEQSRTQGEARFVRAYLYHQLLRYFARPYTENSQDSVGVPLLTQPIAEQAALQYPGRASLGEVYNQIYADLEAARKLLAEPAPYGRPGSAAVDALAARIHLQQRNYAAAAEAADRVLNGPFSLLSGPAGVYRQEGSAEEVWFTAASAENPMFAGHNWAYGTAFVEAGLIQQSSLTEEQRTALQQAGYRAIDLRDTAQAGIADPLLSADGLRCLKYEDSALGDDAPVIRLPECLLIRAEAALELGDKPTAVALLNQLRQRNYRVVDENGQLISNGFAWIELRAEDYNEAELMQLLRQERRLELAFEGHYLFDLQRWRLPIRPGVPWDDPRLRLPIPQRELDANPNLVQNPGY